MLFVCVVRMHTEYKRKNSRPKARVFVCLCENKEGDACAPPWVTLSCPDWCFWPLSHRPTRASPGRLGQHILVSLGVIDSRSRRREVSIRHSHTPIQPFSSRSHTPRTCVLLLRDVDDGETKAIIAYCLEECAAASECKHRQSLPHPNLVALPSKVRAIM